MINRDIEVNDFGRTRDGRDIHLITITNSNGTVMELTDMGASLVSLYVSDRNGEMADVVLGHRSGECYERYNGDLFGTIVGRNANRISGHSFTLNGIRYELADNCRGLNIHSGPFLYGERLWEYEILDNEEGSGIVFSLFSPDGDQGMPGNLNVSVSYILSEDNSVIIRYNAISDKDTVINLTNHSYFNLNGHDSGSIDEHYLWINAEYSTYSLTDDMSDMCFHDIIGTSMDFTVMKPIGECVNSSYKPVKRCRGLDHNFCIRNGGGEVVHAARLESRLSGRRLDVYTDRPGLQVYTANGINNKFTIKNNAQYMPRCGIALETQHYPDAVNHPEFPSPFVRTGERFDSCTVYRFSLTDEEHNNER